MITKRDYIRIDPDWVEKLEAKGYPDGAIAAFGKVMGACEGQNPRGFFKNATVLRGHLGKHGRWLKWLIDHGDMEVLPDGRLYMDGWIEWQEGDWKVRDRVARIRNRRKTAPNGTPPTVTSVTPPNDSLVTAQTDTTVTAATVTHPSDKNRECSEYEAPPQPPRTGGAVHASRKSGPALSPEATALVQGYQELGYVQPSATDLVKAGEFIAELAYLTVAEMLERMKGLLAWCERTGNPRPQSLGGFWNSLRTENDYRRDNGARPRDRVVGQRTNGLSRIDVGAVLRVEQGGLP